MRGLVARWLARRHRDEARDRLAAMVEARRSSPEIVQFRQRRAAALKGAKCG